MNGAALAIDPVRYVHIITDLIMMSTESLHSVVIETTCALSCVSHINAWRVVCVSMTQLGLPSPRVHIIADPGMLSTDVKKYDCYARVISPPRAPAWRFEAPSRGENGRVRVYI